ncbi:large ribosomal subunit protein bL35 [Candidatus Mycoplasma haematominutum]|uniref:Large ribosomal subunit protein bL35 n=1 Tax=Candidatus Mycoplasma haematominutum 'Birmingham 1' TaxID=1116213 RepID=G8C3M8_9MOLU|nr:50S ribosomal protein L35 [Candidatus Mycoplasma haematominutum]CCE66926.1 ribosomal protein L35 [Candidatus Mycoplasma haematominutum 'Birmingham 1']
MKRVKKIKHKTKKALSKRVVVLGSGKIKRKHSHRSHCASAKSTKQKKQLRKSTLFNKAQEKITAHLLQGKRS